jgi:hypothetical protein
MIIANGSRREPVTGAAADDAAARRAGCDIMPGRLGGGRPMSAVSRTSRMLPIDMRRRIEMPPRNVLLVFCAVTLVGLVLAEGWTWPLKLAAVMLPVSYLVG